MLIGYYLLSKIMSGFYKNRKPDDVFFSFMVGGYIKRRQKSIKWNQYLFRSYIKSIYITLSFISKCGPGVRG